MKRIYLVFLISFLIAFSGCVHTKGIVREEIVSSSSIQLDSLSNQPRPDWVDKETESDGQFHYFVGISRKFETEQDAREDAFRNAVKHLAAYIGVDASIDWKSLKMSDQLASQITDFTINEQEDVRQVVNACFSCFKAKDWYAEKDKDGWKVYVRAKIPVTETEKAIGKMSEVWKKIEAEKQSQQQLYLLLPVFNKIASLTNKGFVTLTTDKKSYLPDEIIILSVHLEKDAYLTIFNYDTSGDIKVLLPNYLRQDNFYRRGNYTFKLKAEKSGGIDRLKVFATLDRIAFFEFDRLTENEEVFTVKRGDLFSAETLANSTINKITALDTGCWAEGNCQYSINAPEIVLSPSPETAFARPDLKIEEVIIENIFPARCGYYRFNPIGRLKITNDSDMPACRLKISLLIPGYMQIPYEKEVYLKPHSSSKIPLFATFDQEKIFKVNENTPVQAQVKVFYEKEEVFAETPLVTIFNKNAIDWKEPASVAGFITPKGAIKEFSDQVIQCLEKDIGIKPDELIYPIAIFEAMMALSPKYVPDVRDSHSFPGLTLDMVKYPIETLNRPTGDCDDFTVFYATCLAAIGRKVVLITIPEHIFLAFDTGIHLKNKEMFDLVKGTFLELDDHIWIPMEMSKPGISFLTAWQAGAEEYNQLRNSSALQLIDLEHASKIYPAVAFLPEKEPEYSCPKEVVNSRVKDDAKTLGGIINKVRQEMISKGDHNQSGRLYALAGQYDKALEEFTIAKNWNNQGNIHLLQEDYEKAEKLYKKAGSENPDNGGICLNQAICCILQGKEKEGIEYFKQAISLYPNYHQVCFDIGFDFSLEKEELKAGGLTSLLLKIKILLEEAKQRLAQTLTPEKIEEKKLEGFVGVREERGMAWEKMTQEELISRVCYWQ